MSSDSTVFGASVLITVVGLIALLIGEATPLDELIWVGGAVALVGVGLLTLRIARLPAPSE